MPRQSDWMDSLAAWGWDEEWSRVWSLRDYPGEVARVVAVDRGSVLLMTAAGVGRGRLGPFVPSDASGLLAVGDWCAVTSRAPDQWRIHERLPRRSALVRRAVKRTTAPQDLAANVDTVFLVCGLDTDRGLRSLERLLAIVLDGGADPVVLLNKTDLRSPAQVDEAIACAGRLARGIPVEPVSALHGERLDSIRRHLRAGATAALLGPSGSGKSTLINALNSQAVGEMDVARYPVAATGAVREHDRRGRHTTVRRQMHPMVGEGLLIDTPGLRELGLWIEHEGLNRVFDDVGSLAGSCRFSDCRHDTEPDCAVRAALLGGDLSSERFQRYLELSEEARSVSARRSERGRQEEKRKAKLLAKEIRRHERFRGRGSS